ncbi:MAG TPA: response regulator [Ohtaekwangia sp.]|uniref:response regulator n=1 Tax=Ohtaekwangia sp. TaxID=2066019 RepID=UPI002F948D1A
MKITLDRKILIGFVLCSIVLLLVTIISFRNSEKFVATNKWVNHTREVLYEFDQILVSTLEAQNGGRGFALLGDDDYLTPFYSARSSLPLHVKKVKELTIDNPAQQANIENLEQITRAHIKTLEEYITLRRVNAAQAETLFRSGKTKQLVDEIRTVVNTGKDMEHELLVTRESQSEKDGRGFNIIFIVLLLIIVIVLLVVYILITTNLKALRKAETEAATQNWNLQGNRDLIQNMQGNKRLDELANIIINHLTKYLHTELGIIYFSDEYTLTLSAAGTYSVDRDKRSIASIRYGEGPVGQAAADKKLIIIHDIPAHAFHIVTGFGNVRPKAILVAPFMFEGNVIGVVELASLRDFTELQKQYIQLVSDSIAIAIVSAQSRDKARELLEETQRQSEELEAQQEELRQANEELHAKTELLESSEAELRTQQQELQLINTELEEKSNLLEEQKEKLEDAKATLETKAREIEITSKYKSEFLANMSHELRTPLNSILILAQLLAENKNNRLGDKEIEYSRNIHNSGTDLLNLINEILDLSKIESGKLQLEIEDVPFKSLVNHISSLFSEVARNKAVELKIDIPESILRQSITTDRQRIEQILRNLLSNAFKFTSQNGQVTLAIYQPSQTVNYRNSELATIKNMIAFSVSDTGIGIPKDKRDIIFEAFQQADGSTKRKYGGTGLGLSISRELASALGGEIHLASEEGKGSTFTLYVPLHFDKSFSSSTERQVEIREKEPERTEPLRINNHEPAKDRNIADDRLNITEADRVILIIEDDENFAKILLNFIHERNYKGIIATQGNAGLSYARHYKPDAILLDMKLPVMDGIEVLKQLKNNPELRHIPVQIISAYDQKTEGLRLGAFDYIPKPVSVGDLQKAFEKIEDFTNRKLKKLLVVEDNEQQNKAIRELIGDSDIKCSSAYRGTEAYDLLLREPFDCVIVDLGLPDMTGFELLEKIKMTDSLNAIPIVVYTGKELKKEDNIRLSKLANTVVLKTADSHERLLDETILFLHQIESKLPSEKQRIIRKLHRSDEVLSNKKILLVDDDMRNIYSLTNALEEEGLHCVTAENGKIALDMLEQDSTIDLVLMDVMMPEMDGYEATEAIRKIERLHSLPIIALTAKAMKEDKEKCFAVGMSDYISKPVNVEQLLSLMRVWLYR